MFRKPSKGFTLVEMLVVITIIGILAAMAIPNFLKAKNKAKEAEARNNLSTIRDWVERYHTDMGQYPTYLAGGNETSWLIFQTEIGAVDPAYAQLKDPLIDKGYIKSYPHNPFMDEDFGRHMQVITDFEITGQPMGDPRFGDQGWLMANVMDDPRFWDAARTPGEPWLQFSHSRGAPNGQYVIYSKGGIVLSGVGRQDHWPGQFFYRSIGELDLQQVRVPEGPANIWDFRVGRYNDYIMGVYGAEETKGIDIIRLNGTGTYYNNPDDNFNYDVALAFPEVMGGGNIPLQPMPMFPYRDNDGKTWYGAPDGEPDGIILAFSAGGWKAQP